MPKPDDLYELIHALTPDEKRYFKLIARQHKDQPEYGILFDVVNKLPKANDPALRTAIGLPPGSKSLSPRKAQLRQLILTAMGTLRRKKNATAQVRELISHAEFLRDKMLFRQSMKAIKKAKILASKFELHASLIEVLNIESWVFNKLHTGFDSIIFESHIKETKKAISLLTTEKEYKILADQLINLTRKEMKPSRQTDLIRIEEKIESIRPTDPGEKGPFMIRHLYFCIQAFHNQLKGNSESVYENYKKAFQLWKIDSPFINEYSYLYPRVMINFLHSCSVISKLEEFPPVFQRLDRFFNPRDPLFEKRHKSALYYQLLFRLNQAHFDPEDQLPKRMESLLDRFEKEMSSNEILSYSFNLCTYHFMCENFRQALKEVNRILQHPHKVNRIDVQSCARLFELVFRFELRQEEIIESRFRSAERFIRNTVESPTYELTFIKSLKAIHLIPYFHQEKRIAAFQRAKREMLKQIHFESTVGYKELLIWVDARANGHLLGIAAKRHLKKTGAQVS